jgi:hypothetical protein
VRVLFDQGTPVPLRTYLGEHKVATAAEMGWSRLSNGQLLDAAEKQFDVLITTDQALRTQQNLPAVSLLCWFCLSRAGRDSSRTQTKLSRASQRWKQASMQSFILNSLSLLRKLRGGVLGKMF